MKKFYYLITAIIIIAAAQSLSQTIPHTINYQGLLKDVAGVVVPNGNYNITFKLYDAETSGTELWTETKSVAVADGIINTQLGSATPLTLSFNTGYWLGVTIESGSELTPRIKLSPVPYSLMTLNVLDESITTSKLKDSAVTINKISDNSISSVKIVDGSITAPDIGNSQVVKSVNSLKDNITLTAGSNISLTQVGNDITINASGGTGGTITGVTAGNGLTGGGSTGNVTLSVANDGITNSMLQNNSVTSGKISDGTIATSDLADNSITSLKIVDNTIATADLSNNSVTADKVVDGTLTANDIGNAQVVKSLNTLKDNVTLVAGTNISITPSGQNLTIASTSSGLGGSGSVNFIPLFTAGTTLGNSLMTQNPIGIDVNSTTASNINPTLTLIRSGTNSATSIGFRNSAGNQFNIGMRQDGKLGISSLNNNVGMNDALVINSANRNVGIGLSDPAGMLEIYGNSVDSYPHLYLSEADGFARLSFRTMVASSKHWVLAGHTNLADESSQWHLNYNNGSTGKNMFSVYGNSKIAFDGEVGIGTTSPAYPLDVKSSTATHVIEATFTGTASTDNVGVYGKSIPNDFYGFGGLFEGGFVGCRGEVYPAGSFYYSGVQGLVEGGSGTSFGVFGSAYGGATGTRYGIYGTATDGSTRWAGYFVGNVNVTGTLSKGGGSFKIDHPLDPANKYLYHSFVESPDMMNIYNGNIITDGSGYAVVSLPDWFEALNKDFRYQLTVIGDFAQAIISQKVQNNQFAIRTDKPNVEVSWQITGIRKDAFAEKNRIPVEVMKQGDEAGKYLYPEAFNQPESMGVDFKNKNINKEKR